MAASRSLRKFGSGTFRASRSSSSPINNCKKKEIELEWQRSTCEGGERVGSKIDRKKAESPMMAIETNIPLNVSGARSMSVVVHRLVD